MKFAKSLAAAALLAGASVSAHASLLNDDSLFFAVVNNTATPSASSTYDLNLDAFLGGKNFAAMATSGSFSVDLSKDSNWTSFVGGLTTSAKYFVGAAGGLNGGDKFAFTSRDASSVTFTTSTSLNNAAGALVLDAHRINNSLTSTTNSAVVAFASSNLGGWAAGSSGTAAAATADNLWAKASAAHAGIAYGSTANFFSDLDGFANGTGVNSYNQLGTFSLSGNTLTYTAAAPAPAAVPLPAAVWMFGAGLMGVLRLTRRKSEAF